MSHSTTPTATNEERKNLIYEMAREKEICRILESILSPSPVEGDGTLYKRMEAEIPEVLAEVRLDFIQRLLEEETLEPSKSEARTELISQFRNWFPDDFTMAEEAEAFYTEKVLTISDENLKLLFLCEMTLA